MPGANYMGGRRNIVKARAKDTISRRQKSHFGRQRLDILARGVSALKPSELANAIPSSVSMMYKPSAQDIDLAHAHAQARTKLPVRLESGRHEFVDSYIPRPVHVLPSLCSPRSRASMRAPSGPKKGKKTRSALCDALDMSDPAFMRGIMDEILAMPDLAGLGKGRQKSKSKETGQPVSMTRSPSIRSHSASHINGSSRSRNQSALPSSSSTKERDLQRPETPSSFQNSVYDISSSSYNVNLGHHPRASSIRSPLTPYSSHSPQVHQYGPDSPGADSRHNKTPPSYDAFDRDRDKSRGSAHRSFSSRQRSFHDSGFSEYDAWNDPGPEAVSPSWSTRLEESYSSPQSMARFSDVKDDWIVETKVGDEGDYCDDSGFQSDDFAADSALCEIPKVIDFGRQSSRRQRSRRQSSVYGALFEQEDPWRTIGVILGLEEDGIKSDVNILPLEANVRESVDVDVEVPLDADHDQLFEEEFDYPAGAFGGGLEEDVTWQEGDDVLEEDWYYPPSTLSKVDNPGSVQREQSPSEMPLENWSSTPMVNALHETATDIRQGGEPMLDFGDNDACDGMLVDVEDELHPKTDRLSASMLDIDDDTCDEMPLEVENELQDPSEIQHGRILEVTALDEVDGQFVGPALSGEDFSSSEEG